MTFPEGRGLCGTERAMLKASPKRHLCREPRLAHFQPCPCLICWDLTSGLKVAAGKGFTNQHPSHLKDVYCVLWKGFLSQHHFRAWHFCLQQCNGQRVEQGCVYNVSVSVISDITQKSPEDPRVTWELQTFKSEKQYQVLLLEALNTLPTVI